MKTDFLAALSALRTQLGYPSGGGGKGAGPMGLSAMPQYQQQPVQQPQAAAQPAQRGKITGGVGDAVRKATGGLPAHAQGWGLDDNEAWILKKESGYRTTADNPTSTAFGLGQLLLANRRSYGKRLGFSPETTDAGQQLAMFRAYVKDRYGTSQRAKEFWERKGWY